MLQNSGRVELIDKRFVSDIDGEKFTNRLFTRLVAKKIKFSNVDFKYCIFDAAYIRYCTFDSCNFIGCRFINSNFLGSSFSGCKFDYALFDKTFVDNDILELGCPEHENLKLKLTRSLRMNYQQLGDTKSVNKAIGIELQATEDHLYKAWKSKESYYRKKYIGMGRIKIFFDWLEFKTLDFIWGNGESSWKLSRTVLVMLLGITLFDVIEFGNPSQINSYFSSFVESPQILLGTIKLPNYPSFETLIFFMRLVMFGFFMSIIIKRFNRR